MEQLGPLADRMVFLGGCATGLLLTDAGAPPIRATLGDYHRLSARLRERGFREDQSPNAPICRWVSDLVVLDVMPTSPEVLGFGNEWYEPALAAAYAVELPSGRCIRMVTGPYFLATKLAAFDDRGAGDYVMSHDLEDVVAVLDGRPEIVDEVRGCNDALQRHLATRFDVLFSDPRFLESLPGHLPGDAASQARLPVVVARVQELARIPLA